MAPTVNGETPDDMDSIAHVDLTAPTREDPPELTEPTDDSERSTDDKTRPRRGRCGRRRSLP